MRRIHGWTRFAGAAIAIACWNLATEAPAQLALGTAFTYQGSLVDGGVAANGAYDFAFALFDAETDGNQLGASVNLDDASVTRGVFTAALDFGAQFDGNRRWLEIGVRPGADSGAYTTLAPRVELTASPHALYAVNAGSASTAITADSATNATHSTSADSATTATFALTAANATNATHATTADSSTNATIATTAADSNALDGESGSFYLNDSATLSSTTLQIADAAGANLVTVDLAPLRDGTGTDDQTLAEVLAAGNDAGGADAVNLGKVGIGVAAPSAALGVNGDIKLESPYTFVVDQSQESLIVTDEFGAPFWQSFTAGASGLLSEVRVIGFVFGGQADGTLTIYSGEGLGGAPLASSSYSFPVGPPTWLSLPISPPVPLAQGSLYTFALAPSPAPIDHLALGIDDYGPYPNGISSFGLDEDLTFETILRYPAGVVFGDGSRQSTAYPGSIDDADADPTNELQTLGLAGSNLTLSNGGGTVSVNDADADPTNELQDLASVLGEGADAGGVAITNLGDVTIGSGNADADLSVNGEILAYDVQIAGWELTTAAPALSGIGETSLALVGGIPSIAYTRNGNLWYVQALNAEGTSWGTLFSVPGRVVDPVSKIELADVGGMPGITFATGNGNLLRRFVRATDATGATWNAAVNVTNNRRSADGALAMINGRPAIAQRDDGGCACVVYQRANDAVGSTWGGVSVIRDTANTVGQSIDLEVIAGFPAVAYRDQTAGVIEYMRALDANGANWGPPVTLPASNGDLSLSFINGRPALAWYDAGTIRYLRADDAGGVAWSGGSATIFGPGAGGTVSLVSVGNRPAIAVGDAANSQLLYIRGADADGTSWEPPVVVDAVDPGVLMMAFDGTAPMISYRTSNDLAFAARNGRTTLLQAIGSTDLAAVLSNGSDGGGSDMTNLGTVSATAFVGDGSGLTGVDPSTTNELQTLSGTGSAVTLSNGGGTVRPSALAASDGVPASALSIDAVGNALLQQGNLRLFRQGASDGLERNLSINGARLDGSGPFASLVFQNAELFGGDYAAARIDSFNPDAADSGDLRFYTTPDASGSGLVERVRIMQSGRVGIGASAPDTLLDVVGTQCCNQNAADGKNRHIASVVNSSTGADPDVLFLQIGGVDNPNANSYFISFIDSNSRVGSVRGNGSGGVQFTSGGADYGEELPFLDPAETIAAGDVVGVFGGVVSLRTEGADWVMGVSGQSAFVGNVAEADDPAPRATVAFMGQIPVRVRGPVALGDFVVASGAGDGTAVAVAPHAIDPAQGRTIVGRAWEASKDEGEKRINVAVGLPEAHSTAEATDRHVEAIDVRVDEIDVRMAEVELSKDAEIAELRAANLALSASYSALESSTRELLARMERLEASIAGTGPTLAGFADGK